MQEFTLMHPDSIVLSVQVGQISPIHSSLARELDEFEKYRTSKLNALRHGAAVASITFEGEKAALLRYLNWVKVTYEIPLPGLSLLSHPDLGQKATEYCEWLKGKDLKWSSIAKCVHLKPRTL